VQPPPPGEPERLRSRRPRVSVITPSFNQARFLDQTMRSVFDQGYPDLDDIVIDGGSTDGSVDILRRYADRLAYWVSEPDGGQTHAINKGMQRAHGQVLAYLNSDDCYLPGALRAVAAFFDERPEVGLAYGDCQVIGPGGEVLGFLSRREFDLQRMIERGEYIPQPGAFW